MAANKKETVTDQFELAVTDLASVFGPGDQLVRELESIFAELRISARGNKIKLEGSSVAVATSRRAIDELATMVANGRIPTAEDVNRAVLQGDDGALGVLARTPPEAGALALASSVDGVNGVNLDVEDGFNGVLDFRLVGAWCHLEGVLTFVDQTVALFRYDRCDDHVVWSL